MTDLIVRKRGEYTELVPQTQDARDWINNGIGRQITGPIAFKNNDTIAVLLSIIQDGLTMDRA
jgi:hypothetical protein